MTCGYRHKEQKCGGSCDHPLCLDETFYLLFLSSVCVIWHFLQLKRSFLTSTVLRRARATHCIAKHPRLCQTLSPGVCKHPRYLHTEEKNKITLYFGKRIWVTWPLLQTCITWEAQSPDSENQNIFAIHSLLWSLYNIAIWSRFSTHATTSSRSQEHCGIHQMFRCHVESAQTTKAFGGIKEKKQHLEFGFLSPDCLLHLF